MDEEAVKIVNFTNGDSVEFNEPGLDSILLADHVKDLPVVVVSVAGEFRQGKSFLLNFFLRYLKNKGRPNWMGDKSTPLRGFEWRAGRERHTTGILLWKEAFVMTNSRGEKVAVLLMDTQGTFDRKSTQRESSTIFSLSVLTSSVQIYNIMRNIGENHLQHLQFFAEYGRLAQQGTGTPFQKLLFLVRDWPKSFGDGYGAEGGRELLKECLEITKEQKDDQRFLREWIRSSFSKIGCFLMPAPGDKELEENFSRIFKEEKQVIEKERAKEALRQKERLEAQRKEELSQLERAREKAEAAAKEARMEAEIRAMNAREEVLKKELDMQRQKMKEQWEAMQAKLAEKKEEKEHDYNMLTGLLMIPAAAVASVVCPDQVPSMARKIEKSFGLPG
ncbi:hypothetical protein HPB50_001737 [Hyalomma asiaticum]|uniref:Uncharacterized protein n=1 Tax=Hyalomma asiaticum TaxID=266040 RepID=A0ACB7RSK5_HYAAI|nr:hypothetical protein HPB50_001737 [Hyalomma asiaticum]